MPKPTLIGLVYSPWTQRAKWALDHHGIGHAFQKYLPVVGEPMLRLQTRRPFGRVSVPVLVTPHGAITDSVDIAKHADAIGSGSKLYDGHEAAVARWVAIAERALDAARGLVLRAVEANAEAQAESVSLPMPGFLKGPTAKFGTRMLRRKWNARMDDAEAERRVVEVLDELRGALDGKAYLDGDFSFADVAMAGVIQAIQPVADRFVPLGPGTRESWTRRALAERYADLVAWRDGLYEKHGHVWS